MTPHIEAKLGDYSKIVLLPGDPLRAKWIAETYLDDIKIVNKIRNMLGFTGTLNWNNKKISISVQGGGIGMASNAIYIHELYNIYEVDTIIRVGSCGGINKKLSIGDIVAATTAHTESSITETFCKSFSPSVTYDLLEAYVKSTPSVFVGSIISSDWFYNPNKTWWKKQQRLGTLAVEMETHILYALANKFNKKSLSICTVSDHLEKPLEKMDNLSREKGFNKMIESLFNSL